MGLGKAVGNVLRYWSTGPADRQYGNYFCAKCRGRTCVVSEIYAAGSAWAALANIDNRNFCVVTCATCKLSEFYNASAVELDGLFARQVRGVEPR